MTENCQTFQYHLPLGVMRGYQLLGLAGLFQREDRPQVHRKLPRVDHARGLTLNCTPRPLIKMIEPGLAGGLNPRLPSSHHTDGVNLNVDRVGLRSEGKDSSTPPPQSLALDKKEE
jgi:hypothetical protein